MEQTTRRKLSIAVVIVQMLLLVAGYFYAQTLSKQSKTIFKLNPTPVHLKHLDPHQTQQKKYQMQLQLQQAQQQKGEKTKKKQK